MKKITNLLLCISCFCGTQIIAQEKADWIFYSQRPSLAPDHGTDGEGDSMVLTLSGNGKDYVFGGWVKRHKLTNHKFLKFSVKALTTDVEQPDRCVLATIIWRNAQGRQIGPKEFPARAISSEPNEWLISQIYKVPTEAVEAEVALLYRWDADGQVQFSSIQWIEVGEMPKRLVRLATIHHKPKNSTPKENLKKFAQLADQAGEMGADIVCLPEGITLAGTGLNYVEVAESIRDPPRIIYLKLPKKIRCISWQAF